MKADARGSPHLIQRRLLMITGNGRFLQEGLIPTDLSSQRTIIIGDRMAKNAVKPSNRAFLLMQ